MPQTTHESRGSSACKPLIFSGDLVDEADGFHRQNLRCRPVPRNITLP